ncbi:hypothetical protein WA158_007110 [Blastocystis sp. Blastoise]
MSDRVEALEGYATFIGIEHTIQVSIPIERLKLYPESYFYDLWLNETRCDNGRIYTDYSEIYLAYAIRSMMGEPLYLEGKSLKELETMINHFKYYGLDIPIELEKAVENESHSGIEDISTKLNDVLALLSEFKLENDQYKQEMTEIKEEMSVIKLQNESLTNELQIAHEKLATVESLAIQLQFSLPFGDSKILDVQAREDLCQLIGHGRNWHLQFRASDHDFDAVAFHRYCDECGETIVVIKTSTRGEDCIFGGYTHVGWDDSLAVGARKRTDKYIDDPDALLFTLRNPHNIPPTVYKHRHNGIQALLYQYDHGPCFTYSIPILNRCNRTNENRINIDGASLDPMYEWDSTYLCSLYVDTAGPKEWNYFTVIEYEVFTK